MAALKITLIVLLGLMTRGYSQSLKSKVLIESPDKDGDAVIGISLLYCAWNGTSAKLQGCPDDDAIGYGGVANFDVGAAKVNPSDETQLMLPFDVQYTSVPPVCRLQLEGENYKSDSFLTRVSTEQAQVTVNLFDPRGNRFGWTRISTLISVICHGPTTVSVLTNPKVKSGGTTSD